MLMKKWEKLPEKMRNERVREYYEILKKKSVQLFFKRVFDVIISSLLLIILSPAFLILAIAIKIDSPGPVFYRQKRVTQYGREFYIHKFRSMVDNADKKGTLVTVSEDRRITKIGHFIRECRLDEVSQLIDVFTGNMTFVGTRPEVVKYVDAYTDEMYATLLLPAGVTSEASIRYKDEAKLLDVSDDVDKTYITQVLPGKMKYNLESIRNFSLLGEVKTMFRTVFAVFGKDYPS